jgi:hypothetical protein
MRSFSLFFPLIAYHTQQHVLLYPLIYCCTQASNIQRLLLRRTAAGRYYHPTNNYLLLLLTYYYYYYYYLLIVVVRSGVFCPFASFSLVWGIFVGIHDDGQTVFITCCIRRARAKLNYSIYPLSSVVINLVL